MSDEIIHIDSVSKLFELSGFGKPKHPLIGIIDVSKMVIEIGYNKAEIEEKELKFPFSIPSKYTPL